MFTAAEIKALETCIDIADPDDSATPEQFAIIEAAYAAVRRAREEHRKIANATLQALAMHLEKENFQIVQEASETKMEFLPHDPFKLFAKFLRDTYAHPNDLPDFDEQDHRRRRDMLKEIKEILDELPVSKDPRYSIAERVRLLADSYKGIRTSLDQALNSGDGTYRP